MRQSAFLILILLHLVGCAGPGPLQRSASGKLFDTGGLKKNKRTPIYNNQYIKLAKQNVAQGVVEEEHEFIQPNQLYSPSTVNQNIYLKNLVKEHKSQPKTSRSSNNAVVEPDIKLTAVVAADRLKENNKLEVEQLKIEIQNLKSLISAMRHEHNPSSYTAPHPVIKSKDLTATGSTINNKAMKLSNGSSGNKVNSNFIQDLINPNRNEMCSPKSNE